MNKNKSTLATYLKRVMALKEERRRTPSEEELKSVAREIGLSEEDLAAIDQAAADHALRGQGFLDHRRFDDAITELEEAVSIAPRRVEWLHALAQAHLGRWQQVRDGVNRDRAEALARECLEIDPHHAASFEVLNELEGDASDVPSSGKRNAVLLTLFSVAMLLTVVVGGIVLWHTVGDSAAPALETESKPTSSEPLSSEAQSSESAPSESAPNEAAAEERDIPITLDAGSTGVVLGLDTRLSRRVSYSSGQSFYTLNAILQNRGVTELDKLGMRLELLDDTGKVVDHHTFDALSKATPVLRPGDAQALHQLKETSRTASTARLMVEIVEQNPAARVYATAVPVDFDWRVERTPDLEITLRERSYRFSENALPKDGSGYFDTVIEIENTGERTLRALKLEAEIVGPDGAWTATDTNHVVVVSGPTMRPGEVRLERFIEKVEARPSGYRLSVVAVQ